MSVMSVCLCLTCFYRATQKRSENVCFTWCVFFRGVWRECGEQGLWLKLLFWYVFSSVVGWRAVLPLCQKTHKAGQKTETEKWGEDSLWKQAYSPQWRVNVHGGYWQVGRDYPSPVTLEQIKLTLQTISNKHKTTTLVSLLKCVQTFQTSFICPIRYLYKD